MDTSDKTISTWTNKVSFWLTFSLPIILICLSVPFLGVSLSAVKSSVLIVGTSLVLIFFLIEKINKKDLDIRFGIGNIISALFCGVILLASLGSNTFTLSFLGNGVEEPSALTLISVVLFSFLFAKYQKDNLRKFGITFLILYILSTLFSIILFVFPNILNTGYSFSLFGSLNSFAIVSAIMLPLAVLLNEREAVKIIKIISIVGIVLSFVLLVILNSKFAFIFASVLLAFNFFKNVIYNRDAKFPVVSFALLTVCLFFIFGRPIIGDFFPKIINFQSSEISPNFEASSIVLKEQIKETPFLGIGPSKFLDSWMKYQPASTIQSSFWNSGFYSGQNSLFYIGVTTGILGLILLLGIILYSIILYFRNLKIQNDTNKNIEQLFFLASALAFAFFSLDVGMLVFSFIGLALIVNNNDRSFNFATISIIKKRISLSVLSFCLFLGITFLILGTFKFVGLLMTENAQRNLIRNGDLESAQATLKRAINIFPNSVAFENNLSVKKQIVVKQIKNSQTDLQSFITDSIFSAKELINYNPDSYSAWNNVGAYFSDLSRLGVSNAEDEAQTAFLQAQILSPKNPTPEFMLGRLSLIVSDIENARLHLGRSILMKDNYSEPYMYLGILEEKNGNIDIAESNYQKAVELNFSERGFANLGNFYLRAGDLENAKESFIRAVALSSNINQNYLTLVMIYSSIGENDKALELLNKMIIRYPEDQTLQSTRQRINAGESFDEFLLDKEVLIP